MGSGSRGGGESRGEGVVQTAQIEKPFSLKNKSFLSFSPHRRNEALHSTTLDLIHNERHHLRYHPKGGNDVYH